MPTRRKNIRTLIVRGFMTLTGIIWCSFYAIGGISVADSLKTVISKAENDTSRMQSCLELVEHYFKVERNIDSMFFYSDQGLLFAETRKDSFHIARFNHLKGVAYTRREDNSLIDSSISCFLTAADIFERLKQQGYLAKVYLSLSGAMERKQLFEESMEWVWKGINIMEEIKDSAGMSQAYYNLSLLFSKQEDLDKTLQYRIESYKYTKYLSPYYRSYYALQLGRTYGELYVQDEDKTGDTTRLDSLMKYLDVGYRIAKEYKVRRSELNALGVLAATNYAIKDDYKTALKYLDTMLVKSKEYNYPKYLIEAYFKTSDVLIQMNEFEKAAIYADSSLQAAYEMDWGYYIMISYERIYDSNKKAGNFEKALKAYERFKEIEDSLANIEKTEAINDLEKKYQTAKKEQENVELRRDSEMKDLQIRQRNIMVVVVAAALVLLVVLIYFIYRQKAIKEQEKAAQIEQRLLRAQLNPHFFFNVLGSIQSFFLSEKDGKKAVLFLSKFSKLMRQVLESSVEEYITLEEEIKSLKNYLELQQVRFGNIFDFEITCTDELENQKDDISIPPMFAQPFLENALEHGLKSKESGGLIRLQFDWVPGQDNVVLIVEDNGVGLTSTNNKTHSGHKSRATQITRERLSLLKAGKSLKNSELNIEELHDASGKVTGTRVRMELPCKKVG